MTCTGAASSLVNVTVCDALVLCCGVSGNASADGAAVTASIGVIVTAGVLVASRP